MHRLALERPGPRAQRGRESRESERAGDDKLATIPQRVPGRRIRTIAASASKVAAAKIRRGSGRYVANVAHVPNAAKL
jgi:hypothetical protein